jgi:hypothetical protein
MSSRPERQNQPGRNPMHNRYCRPIEERELFEQACYACSRAGISDRFGFTNCDLAVAVAYDRSTSIRDVQSLATGVRAGSKSINLIGF